MRVETVKSMLCNQSVRIYYFLKCILKKFSGRMDDPRLVLSTSSPFNPFPRNFHHFAYTFLSDRLFFGL